MPREKLHVSEEEIQKMYDPDTFYEYGDDPANKKYIEIMSENLPEHGEMPDYRSYIVDNRNRWILALNWESFMHNQLKCYNFLRAFGMTAVVLNMSIHSVFMARRYLPVGRNGITSIRQTQLFRIYGPIPCALIAVYPIGWLYALFNSCLFTADKFYNHVIMGERLWIDETLKWNHTNQHYQFNDSPLSCEEAFPDVARGLLAQKEDEWDRRKRLHSEGKL